MKCLYHELCKVCKCPTFTSGSLMTVFLDYQKHPRNLAFSEQPFYKFF